MMQYQSDRIEEQLFALNEFMKGEAQFLVVTTARGFHSLHQVTACGHTKERMYLGNDPDKAAMYIATVLEWEESR